KYETVTSMSEIKAGDIIVFKGHVGIAIGNGQMIDASSSEGKIRYGNLSHSYWKKNFIKACRLF
ncbi:MAG: C40 family peptidase, partial [Christensenellaceae bacterium]|nr:C40 family peptidase [Christensenellaceae bacterium]